MVPVSDDATRDAAGIDANGIDLAFACKSARLDHIVLVVQKLVESPIRHIHLLDGRACRPRRAVPLHILLRIGSGKAGRMRLRDIARTIRLENVLLIKAIWLPIGQILSACDLLPLDRNLVDARTVDRLCALDLIRTVIEFFDILKLDVCNACGQDRALCAHIEIGVDIVYSSRCRGIALGLQTVVAALRPSRRTSGHIGMQ